MKDNEKEVYRNIGKMSKRQKGDRIARIREIAKEEGRVRGDRSKITDPLSDHLPPLRKTRKILIFREGGDRSKITDPLRKIRKIQGVNVIWGTDPFHKKNLKINFKIKDIYPSVPLLTSGISQILNFPRGTVKKHLSPLTKPEGVRLHEN